MFHIVGTNHELQHNARASRRPAEIVDPARVEFTSYLRHLVDSINPSLIAEEMTEQLLSTLNAESNVKKMALDCGTGHMFCDANMEERRKLGIPDETESLSEEERHRSNRRREAFWLEKLNPHIHETIILVCGAGHVMEFSQLLTSKGIRNTVVHPYWGKEIYDIAPPSKRSTGEE